MTHRARIGVLADLDQHGGGRYQYALSVLEALSRPAPDWDVVLVDDRSAPSLLEPWLRRGWTSVPLRRPGVRGIAKRALRSVLGEAVAKRAIHVARLALRRSHPRSPSLAGASIFPSAPEVGRWLRGQGIDLMLYPSPTPLSFASGIPYVMAVHDLQHRIQPEFPEVSYGGEWEIREELFSRGIHGALAVLVDSEIGRDDVLQYYRRLTEPERVSVLPFTPPPYLAPPPADRVASVLRSLETPPRYLLFPAQFWPHKNHVRVTEAIASLHRDGVDVPILMTGSAGGPLRGGVMASVRSIARTSGIDDLVRIVGYVPDDLMPALYVGSAGVILPTFFGPTNIPVIEAWALGVPVLTSDIRGIREQCGDAAILVDPRSVESIALGVRRLWEDVDERRRLIEAGHQRVVADDPSRFRNALIDVLKGAIGRMEGLASERRHA